MFINLSPIENVKLLPLKMNAALGGACSLAMICKAACATYHHVVMKSLNQTETPICVPMCSLLPKANFIDFIWSSPV